MSRKTAISKYAKFLFYVLGHSPDEFGLVPDPDGYVKIKELLKAVTEEDGWKSFRKSHIDEILISMPEPPIECHGSLVRAKNRQNLKERLVAAHPPKILYTAVRRKAYPFVLEKGIHPMGRRHIVLSFDKAMAERIGGRIDALAVILTIQTEKAGEQGSLFFRSGDNLFLSTYIPTNCFTGPALPKEPKEVLQKERVKPTERDAAPGSFFPDLKSDSERHPSKKQRPKKEIDWKEARRRNRRR